MMREYLSIVQTIITSTDKNVWIALAILLFSLIVIRKTRRHFRLIKTFQTELGEVFITQQALIKAIVNICTTLGLTTPPGVKVVYDNRKLRINLYIKLAPEQSFGKLSTTLQETIKDTLIKYLGLEQELKIDIILTSIRLQNDLS